MNGPGQVTGFVKIAKIGIEIPQWFLYNKIVVVLIHWLCARQ